MRSILALGLSAAVLFGPVRLAVLRARWTILAPRAAIVLWQALFASTAISCLSAVLLAFSMPFGGWSWRASEALRAAVTNHPARAMTPNQLFALTAGLIVATLASTTMLAKLIGLLRSRAHHRLLVDLVGEHHLEAPGALVITHDSATAYCLPGFHPRIVVSSAALTALSHEELDAVLAHERAHVRARHHLVLLPYVLSTSMLARSRSLRAVRSAVSALVEMAADDTAMRTCSREALARALCRLTTLEAPPFALGAASTAPTGRVERALCPRSARAGVMFGAALATTCVVALPALALFLAGGW